MRRFTSWALLLVFASAVAILSAQAPPATPVNDPSVSSQTDPPGTPLKVRTNDVPTPAVLEGLQGTASELPGLPAGETPVTLPDVWETDEATGGQYRRGEVLVQFVPGIDAAARMQAMNSARTDRALQRMSDGWELLSVAEGTPAATALTALRAGGAVRQASLNYRATTYQHRPDDEYLSLQWNFEAIDLPRAWEINAGATTDVTVAVIDTGLNTVTNTFVFPRSLVGPVAIRFAQVPDLVTDARIVKPFDFVYGDEFPLDLGGHGTHVAGTIAQETNNAIGLTGVAYNVRLMPLKVLSGGPFLVSWDTILNPGNRGGSAAVVATAIRYAADNGANVINLSLGFPGPIPIVHDALVYAVGKGVFVAMAAGNSGHKGNPTEYPAAYGNDIEGAMTVGAVNQDLRHAYYSTFRSYVEICAPGGETIQHYASDLQSGITQIGYNDVVTLPFATVFQKAFLLDLGFRPRFDLFKPVSLSGTSMASPHIAGVGALLHAQGLRDPKVIEQAIKSFARPIDATAEECGSGLVDPRSALRGLGLAR